MSENDLIQAVSKGHEQPFKTANQFIQAALTIYQPQEHQKTDIKVIEQCVTWTIGDLTVFFNAKSDEVFVSGANWQAIFRPDGSIKLTGKLVEDDDKHPSLSIRHREFLTLLMAIGRPADDGMERGETYVRIYPSEPSGREIDLELDE